MYWSGDLAYRDADGWIYLAGRTGEWLRVDGENLTCAPIERILHRLTPVSRVAVYAVPDERVGDAVMAAIVLRDDAALTPAEFGDFLADQPDLSPKAWPRYVWIAPDLPVTATNKIIKRELSTQGIRIPEGTLWTRDPAVAGIGRSSNRAGALTRSPRPGRVVQAGRPSMSPLAGTARASRRGVHRSQ